MATGRTVNKFLRIYAGHEGNIYPSLLCGLTRSAGPLVWEFPEIDAAGMCDNVMGYLPGQPIINPGNINVIIDPLVPTTSNLVYMYPNQVGGIEIGSPLITQIVVGIRAEPILGDPVFGGLFPFLGATEVDDGGLVTMNFNLGASEAASPLSTCPRAWGQLLHPYGQETGANSATGANGGAASSNGGIMLLNVFNSDGASATLKVEHSTDNSSWADLAGATITFSNGFVYSYYALVAPGTTVNQYLRWQSTVDTNTFVMSFIRG